MGRCKSLGSLTSFLSYTSQLFRASLLCFHILSSAGLTAGSGCGLTATRLQAFFPSRVSAGLTVSLLAVAMVANDCDILCLRIQQEIFHFSCMSLSQEGFQCEGLQGVFRTNHGLLNPPSLVYAQSCLALVTARTVARQALLSVEFSRQEDWSGLLFPTPWGFPNPGI